MKITDFSEVIDEIITTAHAQVWCSVGTVDTHNRPHVRVLHPIWERAGETAVGWIATSSTSPKAKHIAHSPYVSLCYDRDIVRPITIDCHAEWEEGIDEKQRIWEWFKAEPPPLGYDPGLIWKTVENPAFGVLKLIPYRATLGKLGGAWRYWNLDSA